MKEEAKMKQEERSLVSELFTKRPALLSSLRALGVAGLADRQALANAMGRALREGSFDADAELAAERRHAADHVLARVERLGAREALPNGLGDGTRHARWHWRVR